MARPRKHPVASATDPQTLVADVLDEVKAVLKDNGISIPLSVWILAQQAAAALIPAVPSNTNNPTTNNTNSEVNHV